MTAPRKCPAGCGHTATALEIICRPCWRILSEQEEDAFLAVFEAYKANPVDDALRMQMRDARAALIAAAREHVTPQLELGG